MAVNKVIYGGNTLIDLTNVSVKSEVLLAGETALDKSGEMVVGSLLPDSSSSENVHTIIDETSGQTIITSETDKERIVTTFVQISQTEEKVIEHHTPKSGYNIPVYDKITVIKEIGPNKTDITESIVLSN